MNHDDMDTTIDESRCVFCGGENRCTMAAGAGNAALCWCTSLRIPRSLLELVPDAARDRVCICRDCIERHIALLDEEQVTDR